MSLHAPAPEPQSRSAARIGTNGASIDVTRRYYNPIDPMLRSQERTMTATGTRTATWHDSYANSIENMSTRYVTRTW